MHQLNGLALCITNCKIEMSLEYIKSKLNFSNSYFSLCIFIILEPTFLKKLNIMVREAKHNW